MRIVAVGDALFSSRNLAARIDPRILDLFATADGVVANAEFVCPARTTPPAPRRFVTAQDESGLDELLDLGIDLLGFANNHTGDFGPQGVVDTIEACERRGLTPIGIGRSLDEARAARFSDTVNGRIGVVAASATRSAEFAASPPGVGIAARPGLNPLRWGRTYVLPDADFAELRRIEAALGIDGSRREVARVEVVADPGPDRFGFGSFFEGSLQIERGERAHVRYHHDRRDAAAILARIEDAAARADRVVFSLHTHEGTDENWYAERPARFVEEVAHAAIDAGAAAVVGHGAHMLRGIEFRAGRPIFYNLNSLLMEFEAGEQKMTPEMYAAYGFEADALPSHLHRSRVADAEGNKIGFYAERRFSRSVAAICDFDGDRTRVSLMPLDLDLGRPRVTERGLPRVASPEEGAAIAADIARMSAVWGTEVVYDGESGLIEVRPPA